MVSVRRAAPVEAARSAKQVVLACVVLALVYLGVILLGDPRAGLIADSGGKLATARVMAEDGTVSPDVGYWAEDLDPAGTYHPLVNSRPAGSGWIQATSVPFAIATAGLWSLAGPLGVVLLSVAGGVVAALAARGLARHLGARGDLAFWLVGLASPLAVYATDAWEHAPAAALALLGILMALETDRSWRAAAAGALLGAAVLLRAETGAYVLTFAVSVLAVREVRRRFTSHPRFLAAGAASAGAVLAANVVLERALVGAGVRDSRATAGALDAGSDLGRRATDAVVTGFGLFPDETGAGIAIGLLLAGMLTLLTLGLTGRLRLSAPTTRILTGFVIGLYVLRLLDGWANVPGALAAVPVVILAATVPRTPPVRVLLGTALGAVPLVWAVQWKGDHIVQWGGRYLLLTSLLLLILAAIALEGPVRRTVPARALLGVTLVVGLAGLGWHAHRTDIVGGTGAALDELPADTVIVSAAPQLGRELGSWYRDRRWLSADAGSLHDALGVAGAADPPSITVIQPPAEDGSEVETPSVDGYHLTTTSSVPSLGDDLDVRILVRD